MTWLKMLAASGLGVTLLLTPGPASAAQGTDGTAEETWPEEKERSKQFGRGLLSGQWLWAADKPMPGIELGLGLGWVELDLELSFVGLAESSPDVEGAFLGNQFGAHLMFIPVRERRFDLSLGLGGDFYLLWGIHSEVSERALAARAVARFWPLRNLGLSVSARSYLFESAGLDLGAARDGANGLPLLIGTGLTWSFL